MSSLIFFTDPDQAVVATDTLACDTDGRPGMLVDKAFIVRHLRMIIAGTGAAGFAERWCLRVNTRMVVRDIDVLAEMATPHLRELWDEYRDSHDVPHDQTTTVYQFGFAEDDQMRAYAFRSTNGFEAEALPHALGVKPPCDTGDPSVPFPDRFRVIMDEQRRTQAEVPLAERVHIGGEVHVIHLTRDGFTTFVHSQFEEYEEVREGILCLHS